MLTWNKSFFFNKNNAFISSTSNDSYKSHILQHLLKTIGPQVTFEVARKEIFLMKVTDLLLHWFIFTVFLSLSTSSIVIIFKKKRKVFHNYWIFKDVIHRGPYNMQPSTNFMAGAKALQFNQFQRMIMMNFNYIKIPELLSSAASWVG